MKSLKLFITLFALSPLLAFAQEFEKGDKVVSFGIGLGSSIGNYSTSSQLPALSAQYEQGVWDIGGPGVISLGGYIGYKAFKYDYSSSSYSYEQKWDYILLGVRSAYHWNGHNVDKLDLYGGLMLGYYLLNYSYSDSNGSSTGGDSYSNTGGLSLYLGSRYYFTGNLAAFAEAGYGVAYLNIGVALKL
ncbi:hypothetical protein J2X69_002052 [Algoriphagus sp. 4150]|uniref:hypothetical protein n=1 Tax=Algoriphagus sp. 4150 TaxID=2817756 RepID=UPI002854F96F|nr:hypothetical protein [Algoriphagus sp. 4150]MDR7129707.1 hypothetical protein [Algoriphagus sp. 4150]